MSDSPSPPPLSETELAVLELVATGATNREIAHARSISEATVKKHLSNINGKLGTGNRTEATRRALELGLIRVGGPEPETADAAELEAQREQQREAARRLAEELERARGHTRRVLRSVAMAALVLLLLAAGLAWLLRDRVVIQGPVEERTSTPAPTRPVPLGPRWLPVGFLPSARDGLALVHADGLYAIGGEDESGVLGEILRYRRGLVLQTWERLADKPTPVRDVGAAAVQGFVVVPGGCDAEGRASPVVELFDTESGAWSTGPDLPDPVCDYALAYLPSRGRIYLFGGRASSAADSASAAVWSLRLGEERWQREEDMARPRSGASAAVVDDQIHLIGGRDAGDRPQVNHWIFRPGGSPPWLDDAGVELPDPRAGQVAVGVSVLRRIYLIGGSTDRDRPAALTLDLGDAGGWRAFDGPLQTPRSGAGAELRNGGREIWLAGGLGIDGQRLNRAYLLEQTPLFEGLLEGP